MDYKSIALILALLFFIGGAMAYTGYNQYYYTNYYTPTTYYANPYVVPATVNTAYYTNPYYNYSYYSSAYYPTTYYSNAYYPAYSTAAYAPIYTAPYGIYPSAYRNISIYSTGNNWGVSYSAGSVCSYYGYC